MLVVEPNETLRKMLGRVARRAGVRTTLSSRPPDEIDQFDGIVVSSRLQNTELLHLARLARHAMPPVQLLGTVHGREVRRYKSFSAQFALPGELQDLESHLRELSPRPVSVASPLATGPASSAPPSSASFHAHTDVFVGEMPELLSTLGDAVEAGDTDTMVSTLSEIRKAASSVGATNVERLARMYAALLEAEALETAPASVADELESAYVYFFRELIGSGSMPPSSSSPPANNE